MSKNVVNSKNAGDAFNCKFYCKFGNFRSDQNRKW